MGAFRPKGFLAGFGFALVIAACTAATVEVKLVCLPMVEYSPVQQSQILAGFKALPQDSILRLVMKDYLAMRDADMACIAGGP